MSDTDCLDAAIRRLDAGEGSQEDIMAVCVRIERDEAKIKRMTAVIRDAYLHNQNAHCYGNGKAVQDILDDQTALLREEIKRIDSEEAP